MNNTVIATPGYFSVTLNTSVQVEMTAKEHSSFYRITFPRNKTSLISNDSAALPYNPVILFDLTDLPETRINGSILASKGAHGGGRIQGSGVFLPSFGLGTYEVSQSNICFG